MSVLQQNRKYGDERRINEMKQTEKWFPFGIKNDKRIVLFCFAHAGGSATSFRSWDKFAGSDVQVVPVELPGHAMRFWEKPADEIQELVKEIAQAISEVIEDRTYTLYGHSFGALLAFLTAYELEKQYHKKAGLLVVSGRHAPFDEEKGGFRTYMGKQALIDEMRRLGFMSEEMLNNEEFLGIFLTVIMNDYKLNEEYQYANEKIGVPILAYSSKDDLGAEPEVMKGWNKATNGMFRLYEMAGSHFFVYEMGKSFYELLEKNIHQYIMLETA